MFSTISALLARIVSNPLANVFQKKLTEKNMSSLCINMGTYFLLSIICFFPALRINWTEFDISLWMWALMGGLFGAIGNGFLIKALSGGELSVLGPINSYKSIVALFISFIVLKEVPGFYGIVGIFLIIWGSYFVFDTQKEGFSFSLLKRKDILYRILATVFTAIEAVFIKKVILLSSTVTSFILWSWFGFLFSIILVLLFKPSVKQIFSGFNLKYLFYIAICVGIMQYYTNYVFLNMNVSYALALFQLSLLLNVFFGFLFFHEKDIPKKILGSIIMILGSVIIILC